MFAEGALSYWLQFHFQVSRARRQLRMEPSKRGNSNRSGAYSVLVSHRVVVVVVAAAAVVVVVPSEANTGPTHN